MTKPTSFPLLMRCAGVAALLGVALGGCDAPGSSPPADTRTGTGIDREALESADLAEVLSDADPFARARRLATLLGNAGPELLPDVKPALRQARIRLGAAEFDLLVRYWATHEPSEAVSWALEYAPSLHKVAAIRTAVEIWAANDPAAAVAAVTGWAQSAARDVAQAVQFALVYGWFDADREGLVDYIRGLGDGVQQQRSLMAYSLALAKADGADAVMRWAEALPDEDERFKRSAFRQVTSALAWSDPQAAERWCEAQCEGPYGKQLRSIIVRARLNTGDEGSEVVEWTARAPEGEGREFAIGVAFSLWALREREEALAWMAEKLAAEEPEPWLSILYGPYARYLSASSPEEAIVWAEKVEGPQAREELMVRIARRWLRQDPAAAEAWIEQSPLSEKQRARARNLALPSYLPEIGEEGAPPPTEDLGDDI